MSITVSLWSKKRGEIKRFLERFYEREMDIDIDLEKWVYIYNKPLMSVDLISAVLDNNDDFDIYLFLQVNDGQFHFVTEENKNDIIKSLFQLYYDVNNTQPVYC
ncbi:MAG TPA: hypothetical protein GXX49_06440 [Clostridiaceae bacterium]|nr:hypothetical protein [Clostridiaceae bacterium]